MKPAGNFHQPASINKVVPQTCEKTVRNATYLPEMQRTCPRCNVGAMVLTHYVKVQKPAYDASE